MPAIGSADITSAVDLLRLREISVSIKHGFNDTTSPSSGPHPALPAIIFACVGVSMAVVFATCVFCARKRMKKRQTEYMKTYMRIATSTEGPAKTKKHTSTGMGQGTFPGYQYGTSEGGYQFTSGYNGNGSSAYDCPPPAYSSHQSGHQTGYGTHASAGATADSSMASGGGSGGSGVSSSTSTN